MAFPPICGLLHCQANPVQSLPGCSLFPPGEKGLVTRRVKDYSVCSPHFLQADGVKAKSLALRQCTLVMPIPVLTAEGRTLKVVMATGASFCLARASSPPVADDFPSRHRTRLLRISVGLVCCFSPVQLQLYLFAESAARLTKVYVSWVQLSRAAPILPSLLACMHTHAAIMASLSTL